MKGAELGSHLWEDCLWISDSLSVRDQSGIVQLSVVFMRPTLTKRQIIAMLIALVRSASNFSFRTLLVLLLLAMVSI